MDRRNDLLKKLDKFLPYMIILFTFSLAVFLNYKYGKTVLDSDMASEMVLADLLNEEGGLISKNWYYSTNLRVFYLQMFFRIGLFLSPNNWHIARVIGQSLLLLVYALAMLFLLSSLGLGKKSLYISSLVLLPLGYWNTMHNIFGGFYTIAAIPVAVLGGLFIRFVFNQNKKIVFLLFLASLLSGMNGMMILLYFSIPSVFVAFICYIFKLNKEKYQFKKMKSTTEERLILGSIISAFGSLLGYLIYTVLCSQVGMTFEPAFTWHQFSLGYLLSSISSYLSLFGYPGNDFFTVEIDPLSKTGIFGAFGFVALVIVIVSIIRLLQRVNKLEEKKRITLFLCLSQIVIFITVLSLVYEGFNGSYLIPLIPYTFVIVELEIQTEDIGLGSIRNIVRILLVLIMALASIPNLYSYITEHPRKNNYLNEVIDYLEENNIDKVMACFWDSNVITELTDGKIETYTVTDTYSLNLHEWLQKKDHEGFDPYEIGYLIVNPDDYFDGENGEIVFDNGYLLVRLTEE